MINTTNKEIVSFGMLRVRDSLNNSREVISFEGAYGRIAKLYKDRFKDLKSYILLNAAKKCDLSDYKSDAKVIIGCAKKHNIYLDRPNDPLCCLLMGIVE